MYFCLINQHSKTTVIKKKKNTMTETSTLNFEFFYIKKNRLYKGDRLRSIPLSLLMTASGCGENVYMASSKNTWNDAIQSWYNEVKDWRYGVGSVNGQIVGHFTQVWRGSRNTVHFCSFLLFVLMLHWSSSKQMKSQQLSFVQV